MLLGKKKCSICHFEKIGWGGSYKIKDVRKIASSEILELIPETVEDDDLVCHDCGNEFDKAMKEPELISDLQEYIQTKQESAVSVQKQSVLKEEYWSTIKQRVSEYKQHWDKGGVIQFKNERMAILQRRHGQQVEFIIAFDDLTKEGYRCVAQDEGQTGQAGSISGDFNSFYYFQKIEYVNCK